MEHRQWDEGGRVGWETRTHQHTAVQSPIHDVCQRLQHHGELIKRQLGCGPTDEKRMNENLYFSLFIYFFCRPFGFLVSKTRRGSDFFSNDATMLWFRVVFNAQNYILGFFLECFKNLKHYVKYFKKQYF